MATDFHEVQFPTDISYGSEGGPEFSTEVTRLSNGAEQRNQNWTYPLERWNVAYGVKDQDDLDTLMTFFYQRKGRSVGFRFKNHTDYQVTTANEIGEGDGQETDFQLVKIYGSGGNAYSRKIVKPVAGTTVIYINDVLQGSGWSVDTTTGIVSFISAPGSGEVITAIFDFDVPMRFDTDYLPQNLANYQARSVSVPLVELRL